MKPIAKLYKIKMGNDGTLSDEFFLSESNGGHLRPANFLGGEDGNIKLPWMKKHELVAWFRKAAEEVEKADFE